MKCPARAASGAHQQNTCDDEPASSDGVPRTIVFVRQNRRLFTYVKAIQPSLMAKILAWVLRTNLVVGGRDLAEGHPTGLAQDLGCAQRRRFCPRHHRRPLRKAPGGE